MPQSKLLAALAAAVLLAAVPAAAQGETLVPPDNSAAIQYTETLPTSGGQKDAEGKTHKVKPNKVLGQKNAHRLESKGKQGREVAEFAAETAPAGTGSADHAKASGGSSGNTGAKKKQQGEGDEAGGVPGKGNGGGSGGEGSTPVGGGQSAATPHADSALGEIAGQATGTSSGRLGLLLPLAILAALGWAAAYFWRQRRRIA